MHINNNAQKLAVENILNQIGELYTKIGDEVILYPLRIVSGIVDFTEHGEFPLKYDIDDFTSNVGIITSNEPIVCYWEGAYKSYVPTTLVGANYQIKHMSADEGRKISTWIMQYSTDLISGEQIINDNAYTTITLNRQIRSFCTDWVPTDNEMRNYLYLYIDKKAKSPQFLQMVAKEPRYLPGGKLAGCELSFANLNQAYSQSGKDILNFVKMVHPGGNYPFPQEVPTNSGMGVRLDPNKLNTRGVNDIQLQFSNSYWLNSIIVYGAPKSNWKITAPRRLLLCNPHPAISSALDVDGSSLNNYYAVFGARTMYQSFWATWTEKIQQYYDYSAKKTYMGGWKLGNNESWQHVMDTNPIANDSYTYNMWNNWTFSPAADTTYQCPETPFTDTSITFSANTAYKPEDFLNHNSFIYSAMEAMPMEYSESTRYTIGDFGGLGKIIQGFVQIFTLGFNPGWTTNNTWVPAKPINFLIPTSTFNFGRLMTGSATTVGNEPIPFDIVNPDFSAGGNKTVVCGYRFQLTRYFQSPSQAVATATVDGRGHNGIWDTEFLGQTQWEDGTWIFDNHQPVKWKSDCKAISPIEKNEEYEVFLASYKGIGLTTCRMTFYNYINGDPANVESVWESRQLTNAKFKNDLTLWTNTYKLNFSEEANNEGVIGYPQNVVPPSPTASSLRITDFEGTYNVDKDQAETVAQKTDLSTDYPVGKQWHNYLITPFTDKNYVMLLQYKENPQYCGKDVRGVRTRIIEYDLTKLIGAGKLSDYSTFTFKLKALHAINYDFPKDITINISDLVDNQWTPIKLAELSEIIAGSNADAYPNNSFAYGSPERTTTAKELITLSKSLPVSSSTPAYIWIKLNKSTQVMQIQMDGIADDLYPFTDETLCSFNFERTDITIPSGQEYIMEATSEIQGSTTGGDYLYLDIDFSEKTVAPIVLDDTRLVQTSIAIPKSILTSGEYEALNFVYFGGKEASHFGLKTTISYVDATHLKIKHVLTGDGTKQSYLRLYSTLYANRYPKKAIRNYAVDITSGFVWGNVKYNDSTFFRGYEISDFYINPNT